MGYVSKLVAEYSDTLTEDINEDLFDRRKGKQIHEFIIDDLKSIEMLSNIYVKDIEYITDPSRIDVKLNLNNIKSKKILKQKLEKLISIEHTAFDALKFTIEIGRKHKVENLILIPKYVDRFHFLVNGNKTLVMFQVIDNAIFNQKGSIILKSRPPAHISKEARKKATLLDVVTGEEFKTDLIIIDLFKKKFSPLFYYAAKKGILETIKYFGYEKFADIVTEVRNPELFHYFKINSNLMIEVEKSLFNVDGFFKTFVGMFTGLFNARTRIDDIYDQDLWIKRLGSLFTSSSKNQHNKGLDVLKSFKNILDATTQRVLRIEDREKNDVYAVMRWIMRDFGMLRNADNHDLRNKRIRYNEYIAAYFGMILKTKVNYALNMKNYDPDKLVKIFKLNEHVLFKALFGGMKACPLFRYNIDTNDLQALNGLKFSITGIQGIPSKRVKDEQRDIYPSHLGKFELNAISSGSPGLSGMLTPFCKIYGDGYFGSEEETTKSRYRAKLKKRVKHIKEDEERYEKIKQHHDNAVAQHEKRMWLYKYSAFRNQKGFINITRPQHVRNSRGYRAIRLKIRFIPYVRNERGFIKIIPILNRRPRLVRKQNIDTTNEDRR